MIGAAFGMGFVMGPYIGARLATAHSSVFGLFNTPHWFGPSTPFWFTAILSLINTGLLLTILPETHQHINKALKVAWTKSVHNIVKAAKLPGLRTIFTSEFLFWGGFTFFTTFFQILLMQKLHFKPSNVGDFFAYIGICIALAQVVVVPVLAKKLQSHQILRISLIGNGVALFLQLWPHNTSQLLLVAPLIALFNGMTMANASALVSLSANRKMQGEVLGIEASVQALAQAIPAAISGYIATMGVSMPVVVGGFVVIAGGIIFNIFYHAPRKVAREETLDMVEAA
jgi:DHA1 family tetracycline resistance protein-like MFS transporter